MFGAGAARKPELLFPVRLDDTIMDAGEAWAASIRRQRQIGDFRAWKDHDSYWKGLERLLRDLRPDGGGRYLNVFPTSTACTCGCRSRVPRHRRADRRR